MVRFSISVLIGFLLSLNAWGFPRAPFDALEVEVTPTYSLTDVNFDFNGIVALSNCSASVVRFSGQPKTSKAYVLTNGHCISPWGGFLQPGEVVYRRNDSRSMRGFINRENQVSLRAEMLVYATMTNTDAALYRLTSTYQDLEQLGVFSYELAFEAPEIGQNIQILSGYWKAGFQCHVDGLIYELREAGWTFHDSIRYSDSGCEIYGGTSGSPVIAEGEKVVVGVNNTGNESGRECTMNNPCEVDKDGNKTVIPGRGYAQQTYWFYSCLSEDFNIDLSREGCLLPQGNN
ncbi:MAG: trypsin-like peptidase domain-containing protein [Bdellovibrionales bacterium]|nr:trypsin-like peptidase domain-containing protein [Bdellovibrionales bacterium]